MGGTLLTEAKYINLSLHYLEQVRTVTFVCYSWCLYLLAVCSSNRRCLHGKQLWRKSCQNSVWTFCMTMKSSSRFDRINKLDRDYLYWQILSLIWGSKLLFYLSVLQQVIVALSDKSRSHIPYRNSMMTSVLRDRWGSSLHRSCNQTTVSNICESVQIFVFWVPNGLTELPKMHFRFPFNLTGNLTVALSTGQSWHVLKSRCARRTQNSVQRKSCPIARG